MELAFRSRRTRVTSSDVPVGCIGSASWQQVNVKSSQRATHPYKQAI